MQKKNSRVVSRLTKIKLVVLIRGRMTPSARLVPGLIDVRWQANLLIFMGFKVWVLVEWGSRVAFLLHR